MPLEWRLLEAVLQQLAVKGLFMQAQWLVHTPTARK